ncbi:hypothetical protein ACFCV3_41655 [Kribbella sp. NPDC056345]|uniref:hypothetical protein n=1 Tax=Kribbella sp. NPDC056345 TaxID=3345789 RepID=UPI0035DD1CB4
MNTPRGSWYPEMPPALPGETDDEYTNRLTGADGTDRRPYDHHRGKQCSIGVHEQCSDQTGDWCGCPCHRESPAPNQADPIVRIDRVRPREPQPIDPAELAAAAALARQAHQTAGQLQLLAERMNDLGWRTDEYSCDDLIAVAKSLMGMSMRAAMHSGDTAVLNDVSGRNWKPMSAGDVLGGDEQ